MNYGATLRTIRKRKGITLQVLANGVCSVSFLSKFERGESDISLDLMTRLLENLMMPFEEFLYIHNEYSLDAVQQFFKQAYALYLNRDIAGLRKLKKEQVEKWHTYEIVTYQNNALLLEVYESIVGKQAQSDEIQKSNVQALSDYLFDVEEWGYYELSLYNGTMLLLEPDMVITLSRTAYAKSARFKEYEKLRELVTSLLFNTVIYLLGPVNRFEEPFLYIREIQEFFAYLEEVAIPEQHLLEKVHLMQLKGIYQMRIGNKDEGTRQVEEAIELLQDIGAPKLAANMELYLEQITEGFTTQLERKNKS